MRISVNTMKRNRMTRRDLLLGAASATALSTIPLRASPAAPREPAFSSAEPSAAQLNTPSAEEADRIRRMKWWHESRFGMFIHGGLYSLLARHEWVMENEGIPVSEYEPLAKQFKPKPYPAREWAKIARETGMRYMVMTTKHHEGFCHFDTKTTNYCSPKQGPGRDLVRERSEEHTSELQSPCNLVCRLLLEKKKKKKQ